MLNLEISKTLLLIMASTIMILPSCKEQTYEQPYISKLPAFNDPVPYSILGQGKLVFQRIGPIGNAYSGFYVIDIDQQRSWEIDCGLAHAPSVSPAGDKIAFTKWGSDQTSYDVYIMDIDGTDQQNITNLEGQEYTPSWTFDGISILFSLNCFYTNTNNIEALYKQSPIKNPADRVQIIDYNEIDPPNFILARGIASSSLFGDLALLANGLRTFDSDGSNMKLVIPFDINDDHFIYSPAWSPDGSKIAVLAYKKNSDITVILLDPGGADPDTLVTLSATGTSEWLGEDNQISLCWSPDGSLIAFTRPDGIEVGSHIYVIGIDHTGLVQITSTPGITDMSLSWSH